MKWLFTLLLVINLTIYLVWFRGQDPLTEQPSPEIQVPEDIGQIRLLQEISPAVVDETTPEQAQETAVGEVMVEAETPDPAGEIPALETAMDELAPEPDTQETETPLPEPPEETAESGATEAAEEPMPHPFVAEPEEALVEAVERCGVLSGVADEKNAGDTLNEMEAEGVTATADEVDEKIHIGYWVLIPPLANAQEAQQKLEELRGKGILDIWHIRAGEAMNAISLGMFSREENARKYRDKMEAQGVEAEIRPRHINKKGYQIAFRISGKPAVVEEYWNSLGIRFPGLKLTESACSLIATGE